MKKIFFILTLSLSCFSCDKYLDQLPQSSLVTTTYYSDFEQLTSALMAVYSELGNNDESTYSRFLSLEAPAANDEDFFRSSTMAVSYYNQSAAYANFLRCWTNCYAAIERANLLLENMDKSSATQAQKDEIRGEALFLRAYYHFILVSYWGDVPLKLTSTPTVSTITYQRTPASEVYTQIVKDMTTASTLVNSVTVWGNTGRISQTAAYGILARVCLHAAGRLKDKSYYPQASAWASKVMASGLHALNPDYKQIFINESADIYDTKECLWEVEFKLDNTSAAEHERFGSTVGIQNNVTTTGFMQANYVAMGSHYKLYAPADSRRDWSMANFYYTGFDASKAIVYLPTTTIWGRNVAKWRRTYQQASVITNKNNGGTNWPLLRYADVLLIFAEAQNEISGPNNEAISAVNAVRERAINGVKTIAITAGGSGYTTPPTVTVSGSGGTGTIATATVAGGVITGVAIQYAGSGYTGTPTVTFTGGGGTGASATATIYKPSEGDLLPDQYATQAAFRQTIMDERSRELAFEGHRKLDLIRWGTFITTMQNMKTIIAAEAPVAANTTTGYVARATWLLPYTNFSARDTLFAVPTQEVSLNPAMKQNAGW